jgi:hypothetical protein
MPLSSLRAFEPGSGISRVVRLADHRVMAQAEADRADRERRIHTRRMVGELPWLTRIRLKYGPLLSLIDLSPGGMQIELEDFSLRPGSTVVVEIVGNAGDFTVPSRVLRCQVASVARSVRYRGALEFKRVLDLPELPSSDAANNQDANPLHAHARLTLALRRLDGPLPGEARILSPHAATRDSFTAVGADAMAAALALLDTPAGRRAGQSFSSELSRLFGDVTRGIEQRESLEELTCRIEERLRRAIPARAIRITDTSAERPQHGSEILYFDAPSADPRRARKILIEFALDAPPHEWQFHLLKASAHLVTLIREVDERRRSAEEPDSSPAQDPPGWNKIVVRYVDGRLLKGYCQDFHPPRGHFQLWPSPTAPAVSRLGVPIGHLKAVFFVREFSGDSEYVEDATIERPGGGRKVTITFLDDEVLVGTTLEYRPDGIGFFVLPNDERSNNVRTFVVSRAVRHVQFV